jgi:hypothetical protein
MNGTFNLEEFYRQMGIKNPQPDMREFVQPVVVVGDFSSLCPQHRVPTFFGGGNYAGVVGEFGVVQITARAKGGCFISEFLSGGLTVLTVGITDYVTGLAAMPNRGPLSTDDPKSIVEIGTVAVNPHVGLEYPNIAVGINVALWVPAGKSMVYVTNAVNKALGLVLTVYDVPAQQVDPA